MGGDDRDAAHSLSKEQLQKIKQIVSNRKKHRLSALLETTGASPTTTGIKSTATVESQSNVAPSSKILIPSTPLATSLLNLFKAKLFSISPKSSSKCSKDLSAILSLDEILRALLMVAPTYTTPWTALCELASSLPHLDFDDLIETASSVEEFLVDVVSPSTFHQNSRKHRKLHNQQRTTETEEISSRSSSTTSSVTTMAMEKDTAEGMLIHFSERLIRLLSVSETERDQTETSSGLVGVLSDWIYCVLRVTGKIDNQPNDLFDAIISKISWVGNIGFVKMLRVIHKIHSLLRKEQKSCMANELLDILCKKRIDDQQLSEKDVPSFLSLSLDMAHAQDEKPKRKGEQQENQTTITWQAIIIHTFFNAYTAGPVTFTAAETSLLRGLQKWSAPEIQGWIVNFPAILEDTNKGNNKIPSWFGWCIMLLQFQTLKELSSSRWSMSDVVLSELYHGSRCSSTSDTHNLIPEEFFDIFLHLGVGKEGLKEQLTNDTVDRMDKIRYNGRGNFSDVEEKGEKHVLSICGRSIWQMLCLDKGNQGADSSFALDRAQRLMEILESGQWRTKLDQTPALSILWTTFIAVAYFDIPLFRDVFVERIREQCTKGADEMDDALDFYFSAVAFIVSLSENSTGYGEGHHTLEPFGVLFNDESMHPSRLYGLSSLLLNIPAMRPRILESTKRMIAPLHFYTVSCSDKEDDRVSAEISLDSGRGRAFNDATSQYGNEVTPPSPRAENGVLCLLNLLRKDNWERIETEAWAVFSHAVVLNLPCLNVASRLWIYQSIGEYVSEGGFGEATKHHLLRSLVTRLASFFCGKGGIHGNSSVEEISVVHRLIVNLLHSLSLDSENHGNRLSLLAQGRDALLRFILASREGHSKPVESFVRTEILDNKDWRSDNFALCWAAFLTISVQIMHLVAPTTRKNSRSPRSGIDKFNSNEVRIDLLIHEIRLLERSQLTKESCTSTAASRLFSGMNFSSNRHGDVDTAWFDGKSAQNRFICILLELLYSTPLPTTILREADDSLSWRMIKGTEHLMNQEWQHDNESSDTADGRLLDQYTVEKTGPTVLCLFSVLVRELVRRDYEPQLADKLFNSITTFCDAISSALDNSSETSDILVGLWDLYNGLASERSAVKIVLYLESHLSDNHRSFSESGDDFAFLHPFRSGKDVNRAIRSLRISCLQALGSAVSYLSTNEQCDEPDITKDLVAGMLEALAEDLRNGLGGESGGISSQLYMSYCSTIEKCAGFVFGSARANKDASIVCLLNKVSSILSHILVSFPLGAAERFKTTFILGLVTLPSMSRSLLRDSLCTSWSTGLAERNPTSPSADLFNTCFDDCLLVLSRWSALRDPLSVPWEDIAGRHHTTSPNNSETSVVSLGSHDEKQDVVGSSHRIRRIRLLDKEVWSWALSCSLLGLKRIWLDSHDVIHTNKSSLVEVKPFIKNYSNWRAVFKVHKGDFQATMSKLVRFFDASTDTKDQVALDMLAMNMPSHPRNLLCSVVACISQVLTEASKHLRDVLNDDAPEKNYQSLPLLESMSCLAAWLSTDSKELREKVSSVAEYVYQLYLALKDLGRVLRKQNATPDFYKLCKTFFEESDSRTQHSLGASSSNRRHTDLLEHYVSLKLRQFLKVLPREFRERSLPDFPAIANNKSMVGRKRVGPLSSSSFMLGLFSKQQKQKKKPRLFMSMHAPSARICHNPALEAMWALDQEADREQDGKQSTVTTAPRYKKRKWHVAADLEDFITPG
ncbi:hypothetical protein IV203_005281 [Nitzschia inconspicua]|uniref:Uncharacterized protein n=1 Tax=Nitzschia inconspicua TaxID=303405 RepID=A0A9K3PG71_9STRA|nr:hypothetical protein IV203_005281 [Nitzschia inconspicua]